MRIDIDQLPGSLIREVANAGLGRADVLPFWFGESDEPTPTFVTEAAVASLRDGETFYPHNFGLLELRDALATYVSALHRPVGPERIAVVSSGVSGLMLAMQALAGHGDEVAVVVPVWPNLVAQPKILGARVTRIALRAVEGRWMLDLDLLKRLVTSSTKVLVINAPNNPTGWVMSRPEQQAVLAHCRRTGTFIVADEVYERIYFGADPAVPNTTLCAPSFLDVAEPDDRLVVVHSFSKSFLMTGWRLGWMVMPTMLSAAIGKLIEFNTSCAPVFVQRGGLAALQGADEFVPAIVRRLRTCRDTLMPHLQALPGIVTVVPEGGMYAFFRVEGERDSLSLAKRLVVEAGLGLAPGAAFGDESEGWLRWCFASREPQRLIDGVGRLACFLDL